MTNKKKKSELDRLKARGKRLESGALLRFHESIKPKSIAEVIYNLLYLGMRDYYRDDKVYKYGKLATYSASTGRSSGNYHRRSIEDTFRICKYYFPKTKFENIYNLMHKLKDNNTIHGNYCHTCHRVVFSPRFDFNLSNLERQSAGID